MTATAIEISEAQDRVESSSRWQILAGLRFILAMVVVASHMVWFVPGNTNPLYLESVGGTAAVLGFLIISGFSIAHSLHRRPIGFYRRRVLRIYPLYITAILFALLPYWSGADALAAPGETFPRPHAWVVVGNLLMLQNIVCLPIDSNTLVWTLGIEVICYLLAPLFRKMQTWQLMVLIAVSSAAYGYYPYSGTTQHYSKFLFGLPLLMFAWAWIAGFVMHRHRHRAWVGITVGAWGCLMTSINRSYYAPLSIPALPAVSLIVTFGGRMSVGRSTGKVLNYLGDLSYPIYLFHLPTFVLAYCIMEIHAQAGLLFMAVAISAAFLFVESILKPVLGKILSRVDPPQLRQK